MRPTYGEHAELTAAAFQELSVEGDLPVDATEVADLLDCRDAVVDALRERLHMFGISAPHRPSRTEYESSLQALTQVDLELGSLLDRVVRELPHQLPGAVERRPSDVLGPRRSDRTVELWRQAAVELLAGTHALETADDRRWAHHHGAGWYVARDVATVVEAVVLLDRRLHDVGLLSEHDGVGTGTSDEYRLIAGHVARVATWYATSSSPDEASPQRLNKDVPGRLPSSAFVQMVSTPTDLVVAQEQLARYLQPLSANSSHYQREPHVSAATARQVITSQLFISDFLRGACAAHPRAASLATSFAEHHDLLGAVLPRMRYLVDRRRYNGDWHARNQQTEITYALASWRRECKSLSFTSAQLLALANATHEVTHSLAHSLRRELGRADSNLGRSHPLHRARVTSYSKHHGLFLAVTDLAHAPTPTTPISEYVAPMQRSALRLTLDLTPTEDATPRPYLAPVRRGPLR